MLTRIDGDGRGGAALSMRAVTGKPIKLIGTGEKLDAIEDFYPARIADRILGMGDIVSLVEKAASTIDAEKAARVTAKMRKGAFDLSDLREQIAQMQHMGGMSGMMSMLPGIAKIKNQLAERNLDETVLKRQVAIIDSMTPQERRNPDVLKASRKRRIAAGSGTKPEDINRLLKMHRTMADVMKAMGGAKRGPMAGLANMLGLAAAACRARKRWRSSPKRCRADCRRECPALPACRRIFPDCRAGCRAGFQDLVRNCRAACRRAFRASERRSDDPNSTNHAIRTKKGNLKMPLVIRMARAGTKKRPFYHIVVADSRSPRDGRFIERLGYFNPLLPKEKTDRLKWDIEKAKAWIAKGAQPSDRVMRFLDAAGVMKRTKRNNPEKAVPRKERKAKEEAAKAAAAAAPKAPAAPAAPAT